MRNNSNSSYLGSELTSRSEIISVISRYTALRKVGRDFIGLSPCHNDRHPSLRVNPEKQVWYCDPCSRGGDIIEFIKIIEGVDFKGALEILAMGGSPKPPRRSPERQAAKWTGDQIEKMHARLRELDEQLELADELGDGELAESIWRERRILADLRDDLGRTEYRADFVQIKDVIEKITKGFE